MKYANYVNPTLPEKSFRELIKIIKKHNSLFVNFDYKKFIHAFKNMVHHSFHDRNPFECTCIGFRECNFKRGILPNPSTSREWANTSIKAAYENRLDGFCIPLKPNYTKGIIQARLVIASPMYGPVQFAIQTRHSGSKYWGTYYCGEGTVNHAISVILS